MGMTNEIVFCDKKVSKLFITEIYEEYLSYQYLQFVKEVKTNRCYFKHINYRWL